MDFWLCCGSQSKARDRGHGGTVTNPAYMRDRKGQAPDILAAVPPTFKLLFQEYTHIRQAGGRWQTLLSLTAEQQKEESHPFFSLLLKSLLPHKALSHTWFFQFLLHKMQHNNKIKRGPGEQWVQQINGQAQPSSAFIAISPEEHSLPTAFEMSFSSPWTFQAADKHAPSFLN